MPCHGTSSNAKERPELNQMTISVNRHRECGNAHWNSQLPLHMVTTDRHTFSEQVCWEDLNFDELVSCLKADFGIKDLDNKLETDLQIVWPMCDSENLGHVYDDGSFKSAVMDYWYTYKRVVQLYIVNKNGKLNFWTRLLLMTANSDWIYPDIYNLPEHIPKSKSR